MRGVQALVRTIFGVAIVATGVSGAVLPAHADPAVAPGVPVHVMVSNATSTSLDVAWTVPESDVRAPISGYTINYREVGNLSWTTVPLTAPTTTTFTATGLDPDSSYQFRVAAVNSTGTGFWSGQRSTIAAGAEDSCSVMVDGSVTCWGTDMQAQLGDVAQMSSSVPVQVFGMTGLTPATTAVSVSSGTYHSCAVMADGKVMCWGGNAFGSLGNNSTDPSHIPVPVSGITGADAASTAVSVSASNYHTCAVMANGSAKCWGYNIAGQLGNSSNTGSSVPVPVSGITGATTESTARNISAGLYHTCAVMANYKVMCWGNNPSGELGDRSNTSSTVPVYVSDINGTSPEWSAEMVTSGVSHSCARMANGSVTCWGGNSNGQLGDGSTSGRTWPVRVSDITGADAASRAVIVSTGGSSNSCALMEDGTAKCWGWNGFGQLGDNSTTDSSVPVQVSDSAIDGLTPATTAVSVSAGRRHSCALMVDGTAKCWGYNSDGQLGDNSTTDSLMPVLVSDITGADSTFGHTLATSPSHLSRPVQLLVTGRDAASIAIRWGVPTDNGGKHIDSYRVSYRPEGSLARATRAIVPYSQHHLRVGGLSAGVTYKFRVRAHNTNGYGDRSRIVSETVPVRAAAPIVVKGVWDHRVITLTWRAVQTPTHSPISAYMMSCQYDKGTKLRTTVNPGVLTASIKVPTAQPYSCRVAAITDAGRGASSVRVLVSPRFEGGAS